MDSREALVALNMVEGVGPIRVRQLLEQFGDAASILKASKSQLAMVRGIGDDTATVARVELEGDASSPAELGAELAQRFPR